MNAEQFKYRLKMVLDLIQLISEDVEENFVSGGLGNAITARGTITLSSLYILTDYLRDIVKALNKEGV